MGLRLLALLCLVGAAFAGPFHREIGSRCSRHCSKPSNPKFDYEVGKKYVYEYRGENYITIAGNRKQKATIEGVAEFHWVTKCEGVLKLRNVRIEQKLSQEEITQLVRKLEIPLSFSYEDGKIEKVCKGSEDTPQSLNIKKGVLSTIINNMSKLDTPQEVKEEDSMGKCLTKYTVKYANGLEVRKVKDLKSCTNRHSSVTSLITSPYDSPESKIHTLPVFPEEYLVCTQSIEEKIIKRVTCKEHAKIKPMKQRESIIQFEGTIELRLLSKATMDLERLEESPASESILYNLEEEQDADTKEREVEDVLREMCGKNHGVIDITVSKDFIKLVSLVKSLSYQSLDKIQKSLKNGRICNSKKVLDMFLDTLPMAGSDEAVKYMVHLLEKKEVGGLKSKIWPASLALIPKPTRHTVAAIVPLLKIVDSAPVLLGVSAMLHRFCTTHECDKVPEVQEIISKLSHHLGKECSSSHDNRVFSVLKAFGNIGYLGEAQDTVIACSKDRSKSLRLRLAAVDAFRRINEKKPRELLDIYTDTEENFELRIAALSSVIKQADEEQIRRIKETAEKETDQQVSGYAFTLIHNMNKTSSPLKKNVRKVLKDIKINLPRVNYWENSKNIEFSAFSEHMNVGGAVEADVIHSSDSKIPRSLYTRFDVDVFDRSMNILEVGLRAEGIEALVQKLIGLKDKVSKRPSWDLGWKDIFHQNGADASLFIRTMNVEIFDIAASDLTAMGELIKIAELMSKLSHERKADFSHSFMFLNAKLVIPSVTGRSYSIDLTGSVTVALTASTKLNLLTFPRNADVKAHFQPSANVEISTTVGIKSNKQRPDIKVVSRMHLESDMEAKLQVKEGHVALTSLSMPSENVVLAKFSTDVLEIDADHNEKRMFDKMQKKIDYCFRKLEKPFGISVCGKWEVPKPFIIRSFPFVQGVGNIEFAIKKSDSSFSSYELGFEIPKQHDSHMKYKASLDTPGSSVNRRFSAELDLKQRSKGKKELSLELTSPFKSAGLSGSWIWRSDMIQASLELNSDSSRLLAFNASSAITSSRSRTVLNPSLEISILNRDPFQAGGSVILTKGKKQQIAVDIKTNKPRSKPISLKGIINKEGRLGLLSKHEWKVSSDLDFRSPIVDAQVRSAVSKQSIQAQKLSTSFSLDYKVRGMQKQTVKLSGNSQKSSSKINTNAQFEMSQFPAANWVANWDRQGELHEGIKNDITVKYGRHHEKTYVTLKHRTRVPTSGPGQCKFAVKAPQFNVDSELLVNHEFLTGIAPKLRLDGDLHYKPGKHVKGLLNLDYESRHPLKALTKAEIVYPGGKLAYNEELEETDPSTLKGKSRFQWREDKEVELVYKYQNHKSPDEHHYELETSLKVPSRQSPIVSKTSLRKTRESLVLSGEMSLRRGAEYTVDAHLNKREVSHVTFKTPNVEGDLKVRNEELKKSFDFDYKVKSRNPRHHVTCAALLDLAEKKAFKVEVLLDADRRPERKILASTNFDMKEGLYSSSSKLQIHDLLSLSLSESGEISMLGSHEGSLEATLKNYEPVSLKYKQETSKGQVKSVITLSKSQMEKAQLELEGGIQRNGNQREVSARAAIKSLDNSFESKEWSMKHQVSKSGSSNQLKSEMQVSMSPKKAYKISCNSDVQPNGMEMRAILQTPVPRFEKQAVKLSFQRSSTTISSSVSIEVPDNKEISIAADIHRNRGSLSATCSVKSPFDIVRDVKVHISAEKKMSKKSLSAYFDVNSARMTDIEINSISTSNGHESKGQLKIAPIPNVSFQGLSYSFQKSSSSQSFSGKIDLANSRSIVATSEIKEERESISATTSLSTPYRSLKDAKVHLSVDNQSPKRSLLFFVDVNQERKGDAEITVTSSPEEFEIQGRMKTIRKPEIVAHLKVEKREESFSVSSKVLKGTAPLWSTVLSKQKSENGEQLLVKTESFEKSLLDLQVSSDASGKDMKFAVKASGQFSPISLVVSTSSNEKSSVNMEIKACRIYTCYSLKAYHKNLINSQNYRHYRKVTFDLEKSSKTAESEAMGSLHFLLSSAERDYRSKFIFQSQEKHLGYEVKVHRGSHENEPCTIDWQLLMPSRSSRVKGSILHSTNKVQLEMEAIPNEEDTSRKFSLEMKKENDRHTNEISGYVKLARPDIEKPFLLTGKMERAGKLPVKGKLEVHYSPSSWFKVLTLEITPEEDRSGKKALVYRIYREDQSVDASLKLMKVNSRDENMYGYDWSYKSRQGVKRGGLSVKLDKKKTGLVRNIDITFYGPYADLKIQSEATANSASLKVMSSGKMIKQISVRASDSCYNFEVQRSGPFFKSVICFNKREGKSLNIVDITAECRRHKCLEARVAVEPENPTYVDVVMEWEKEEFRGTLSELSGLKSLFGKGISKKVKDMVRNLTGYLQKNVFKVVKEIIEKLKKAKNEQMKLLKSELDELKAFFGMFDKVKDFVKTYVWSYLKENLQKLVEEIVRKILKKTDEHVQMFKQATADNMKILKSRLQRWKSLIPWAYIQDQIITPFTNTVRCLVDQYGHLIMDHIPNFWRAIWDITRQQFEHCLKKYCSSGTFCHDFVRTYQRHGYRRTKQLVQNKIQQTKRSMRKSLETLELPAIFHPFKLIKKTIELVKNTIEGIVGFVKDTLQRMFGKLISRMIIKQITEYVKKYEELLRKKAVNFMDYVIKRINDLIGQAQKDEDIRTAISLVKDAKKKAVRVWKSREELAKQAMEPIEESIKENIRKSLRERIQVTVYNPKEGKIRFRIRNPLGEPQVEVLKNEIRTIKRKLLQA